MSAVTASGICNTHHQANQPVGARIQAYTATAVVDLSLMVESNFLLEVGFAGVLAYKDCIHRMFLGVSSD